MFVKLFEIQMKNSVVFLNTVLLFSLVMLSLYVSTAKFRYLGFFPLKNLNNHQ